VLTARTKLSRVLIVDDQSQIRIVLRRALERSGLYEIGEATTASEALATIRRAPPDALVLDISMPGAPGFSIIPTVRRISPSTRILVLSSHYDMAGEVLIMGADAFLPKTTPAKQVLSTLATILRS
jgi:DNA-binding NarL/FixJ family response regulator